MENEIDMITALQEDDFEPPIVPEEIIMEILLRLPVKSLLKFRCVSKSWSFLISSYKFAKAHLNLSTKNDRYAYDKLVFGSNGFPLDLYSCTLHSAFGDTAPSGDIYPLSDENLVLDRVSFDYPLYEPDDSIRLHGSCNGLVCVSVSDSPLIVSDSTLILWNPTTGKSRVLPESGTHMNFKYCAITYGFGYDELHDDYKVVEFFVRHMFHREIEIQVKVYSLRTNSWTTLSNWPGGNTFGRLAKFLNGAIHCIVSYMDEEEWAIISHDLSTDTFAKLPLPDIEDNDFRMELKLLGGCLSVCCEHNTYMDVWVMKEYGVKNSWTKVVRIPFDLYLEDTLFIGPSPLFILPDGKILMNYRSNLRIYDPRYPYIHHFGRSIDVDWIIYIESLVSPNLDD